MESLMQDVQACTDLQLRLAIESAKWLNNCWQIGIVEQGFDHHIEAYFIVSLCDLKQVLQVKECLVGIIYKFEHMLDQFAILGCNLLDKHLDAKP